MLNDFANPLKIIKPESQNMDMPAMKPVMPNAIVPFRSPVLDIIKRAIVIAAPVSSSMIAIMAPKIIRKPIEAIVLPKASCSIVKTFLPGIATIARRRETKKREMNALSFHFDVSKIMHTMLITTSDDKAILLIIG